MKHILLLNFHWVRWLSKNILKKINLNLSLKVAGVTMKFHPEFFQKIIFLNLNDKFGKVLESKWFKVLVVRCVKKFGWDNSLWLKNSPGERGSFKNREVLIGENSNSNWENIRGSLYVILFTLINVVLEMRKCFNTKLVLDDRFYT